MGLMTLIFLDDIIKQFRPPRCDTDEDRKTINKGIQCPGRLLKLLTDHWSLIKTRIHKA